MNRLLGLARRTIASFFAMLDSDRADAALRAEMRGDPVIALKAE